MPSIRSLGLLIGLSLVLLIPTWTTFGVPQASVLRVAVLCTIPTILLGRHTRISWVDVSLFGLISVIVLGWLLQNNQPSVGSITLTLILPVGFFLAARELSSREVRLIMNYTFFLGSIAALTVLYEFTAGQVVFADPTSYYWTGDEATIFRPGGVFGSPPAASTVLILTALCGLPLFRQLDGVQRSLFVFCFAVVLLAVALTFTRAAFVAFALGLVAYLWLSRSPILQSRRLLPILIVGLVAVIVFLPRLEGSRSFQQGVLREGTFSARVDAWELTLPIVRSSTQIALFGLGTAAAEAPAIGANVPLELATAPELVDHGTHNQYIHTVLHQGAVGLFLLLTWLLATIGTAARSSRVNNDRHAAALGSGGLALAALMVVGNVFLNPPSLAMAMLISGLVVALTHGSGETEDQ